MTPFEKSRRVFTRSLACAAMTQTALRSAAPTIRVAAVQMTAELANVERNLAKAEQLVQVALAKGAKWVVLPECFTSAVAFHPDMPGAVRHIDGAPARLLMDLARKGNAVVGGSFLAWSEGNVYNSFVLALPDGRTLRHDKDYPTYWETCYYKGGTDDGILPTPDGDIGVALCWEFIRTRTVARLKGKVGLVVGGSCWWTAPDSAPADHPSRVKNLEIVKATPRRFARLLGVPVVHAAHAGNFVGQSWPVEGKPYPSHFLGETQVVDGNGVILARMAREEGEGVITADIRMGPGSEAPEAMPTGDWIADFPEDVYRRWKEYLRTGHEHYVAKTIPAVRQLME